jgi:hypothetical protein
MTSRPSAAALRLVRVPRHLPHLEAGPQRRGRLGEGIRGP